jgi:hypothetical protein
MKSLLLVFAAFLLFSCSSNTNNEAELKTQIDDLKTQLANTYKPELGELMTDVQAHHAKLYYAGHYQNWKLADYELKELQEIFDDIKKYNSDRQEVNLVGMIQGPLNQVTNSIKNQDVKQFEDNFSALTNTCNACHVAAKYEFNVVKIPEEQMFSNQDFKPKK